VAEILVVMLVRLSDAAPPDEGPRDQILPENFDRIAKESWTEKALQQLQIGSSHEGAIRAG